MSALPAALPVELAIVETPVVLRLDAAGDLIPLAHRPRRRASDGTRGGANFSLDQCPYDWPAACGAGRGLVYVRAESGPLAAVPDCPDCLSSRNRA